MTTFYRYFIGILLTLFLSTQAWSTTGDHYIPQDNAAGVAHPVGIQATSGEADGNKFVSFGANIYNAAKGKVEGKVTEVTKPFYEWSYSRGIGRIPNTCPAGYSESAGLCAQNCPAGFNGVGGVCWQQCPPGWSNGGVFCTLWKWWPETIVKQSWVQQRKWMNCPAGKTMEAGLCYQPCADTFTGVGPLCFGRFGGLADQSRIRDQAGQQHSAAEAAASTGGVHLNNNQIPKLKTDMSFTPIVCGLAPLTRYIEPNDPITRDESGALYTVTGKASELATAWLVPSLSGIVFFNFTADLGCEDDGVIAKSSVSFKPTVTVKADTKMFDPVLHNLAGIDAGIMQISIYELIPFRVYGSVGTTLGAETTITSIVDRSQPPVIIDGKHHANSTTLEVKPDMGLWLSATAYLRITSIFSFIPDLVQLGAEFKLWMLELAMPYNLEEGVRNVNGVNEVYKTESLDLNVGAGSGYVDTFLKVLGFKTNAFGDKADITWQGYKHSQNVFSYDTAETVSE